MLDVYNYTQFNDLITKVNNIKDIVRLETNNIFSGGERHKCYINEVEELCGLEITEGCGNRIRNKSLCDRCDGNIKFRMMEKANFYHKEITYFQRETRNTSVGCCTCRDLSAGYKNNINVSSDAFDTLLLVINRYKINMSKDIRKMIFKYCGNPGQMYFTNNMKHSVFSVRNVKQYFIRNKTDRLCPYLVRDIQVLLSDILLRLKYKFHDIIKLDPKSTSMLMTWNFGENSNDIQHIIGLCGMTHVILATEKCIEMTISWEYKHIAMMCESSLLKVDERYDLLKCE